MSELIFVTGATGFLGSHVVEQLLKKGYRVRATARGKKAVFLKSVYASNSSLEVIEIADIAFDDFSEAFRGVDAVIHVASPLASKASADEMYQGAIEGSLNVLRQAEKVGVKKFVVTSSIVTVSPNANGTHTDKDWNLITKEAVIASGQLWHTYAASKKYAELAIWEWAEANPHVDVTTINPPHLFGPTPANFPVPPLDFTSISSNLILYQFISKTGKYPSFPGYADFRDVAKAHIGALHSPPTSETGRKRIVFSSPHGFNYKHAVELLEEKRPQVKERLIPLEASDQGGEYRYNIDFDRIEKVTGMKKGDFYTFDETFLDTIDALLRIEEEWKSQGHVVDVIPPFH